MFLKDNIHIYQIYLWTPGFPKTLGAQLLNVIVDTNEKLLNAKNT